MATKNLLPAIADKQELLSEMDSLMILGGEEGQVDFVNKNTALKCELTVYYYCNNANCVPGCGDTASDSENSSPVSRP